MVQEKPKEEKTCKCQQCDEKVSSEDFNHYFGICHKCEKKGGRL